MWLLFQQLLHDFIEMLYNIYIDSKNKLIRYCNRLHFSIRNHVDNEIKLNKCSKIYWRRKKKLIYENFYFGTVMKLYKPRLRRNNFLVIYFCIVAIKHSILGKRSDTSFYVTIAITTINKRLRVNKLFSLSLSLSLSVAMIDEYGWRSL